MPPHPDRSPARVIEDLADVLTRLGVDWYVFGAQAVTVHGRPRLTGDIDVTVDLDTAGVPGFVEALSASGFRLRVDEDAESFVRQTSILPFRHAAAGIDVDIVVAGSGLEAMFLDRVVEVPLGRRAIPFIDASDLVIAKILAGRPKDLEDAVGIVALQADRLDHEHIEHVLQDLGEALAMSELSDVFHEIVSRGRRGG